MSRRVIFLTTDARAQWGLWASQNNYQQYAVLDTSNRSYDALPSSAFPADIVYANSFPLPGDTIVPGEGKSVYVLRSSQPPTRWPTDAISLTYLMNQQLEKKATSPEVVKWWVNIASKRKLRSDRGNYLLPLVPASEFKISISDSEVGLPNIVRDAGDVLNILETILDEEQQLIWERALTWSPTQRMLALILSLITYQPTSIAVLAGSFPLIANRYPEIARMMVQRLVPGISFRIELSIGPNVFLSKADVKDTAGTFRQINIEDALMRDIFRSAVTERGLDLRAIKPLLTYLSLDDDDPDDMLTLPGLTGSGRELIIYTFVQKGLLHLWQLGEGRQNIYRHVHRRLGDLDPETTTILPGVRNYPVAYEHIFEWKVPLPMKDVLRRLRVLEKQPSFWKVARHRAHLRDEDLKAAEEKWGVSAIPLPVRAYRDIVGGLFLDLTTERRPLKEGDVYKCEVPECWSPTINIILLSKRLGRGLANLARQPGDPIIRFRILPAAPGRVYPIVGTSECSGIYGHDSVQLTDISEFDPKEVVVIPDAKDTRCYVIESVLGSWESALSLYDSQSNRIVPSYPRFSGINVEPAIVRSVILTARDRKVSLEGYPIIVRMAEAGTFLDDLYEFIQKYDQLTRAFDLVTPADKIEAIAASTRRDLVAGKWLEAIAVRNGIAPSGYRKYRSIPSTRGSNGTQAFLSCVITAWIVKEGYGAVTGDGKWWKWMRDTRSLSGRNDPARPCLTTRIIDNIR